MENHPKCNIKIIFPVKIAFVKLKSFLQIRKQHFEGYLMEIKRQESKMDSSNKSFKDLIFLEDLNN